MPPETRSQKTREAIAVSDAPPETAFDEEQRARNVQLRQSGSIQFTASDCDGENPHNDTPDEPPYFVIDLSLPPEQRYLEVCAAFKSEMLSLTSLFDEVVGGMVPFIPLKLLRLLCKTFLRKVFSKEAVS